MGFFRWLKDEMAIFGYIIGGSLVILFGIMFILSFGVEYLFKETSTIISMAPTLIGLAVCVAGWAIISYGVKVRKSYSE